MTFHFQNLPLRGIPAFVDGYGRGNLPHRRAPLIARWQRGADGHLECRWLHQPMNFLPE